MKNVYGNDSIENQIIQLQLLRLNTWNTLKKLSGDLGKDAFKSTMYQETYELWSMAIEGLRNAAEQVKDHPSPYWQHLARIGTNSNNTADNDLTGIIK